MSHKIWFYILKALLLIQLCLLSFLYVSYGTRAKGDFFYVPPKSDAIALYALDRPNVSPKALLSWATLAATATFTLDFVNYEQNIQALQEYFTVSGYDNFLAALEATDTQQTITDKKLVLSAVATGPAIILQQGDFNGSYVWMIEVPILVNYQSATTPEKRQKIVSMLIAQVPTQRAPKGIGIAKYIAQDVNIDLTS